jgi:hypothetical protein
MRRFRKRPFLIVGAALLPIVAVLAVTVATGSAASQAAPVNTQLPKITGKTVVGQALKTSNGKWTGGTTGFAYQWQRCNATGGVCAAIAGATKNEYMLTSADVGSTIRVVVTATNKDGSTPATSAQTAVVTAASAPAPTLGCTGKAPLQVTGIAPPDRLTIDGQQMSPSPAGRSTATLTVRFHVSCAGKSVQGALVYVTAVPYNQFSIPAEQRTGADGWATLTMNKQSGYPATKSQQLLVMFVRARKQGENVLAGISTRRLVSFKVDLTR